MMTFSRIGGLRRHVLDVLDTISHLEQTLDAIHADDPMPARPGAARSRMRPRRWCRTRRTRPSATWPPLQSTIARDPVQGSNADGIVLMNGSSDVISKNVIERDTLTNNVVNVVSGVGIAVGTGANSGNATANTPQAVTASMASLPSVASVLGWAATGVE